MYTYSRVALTITLCLYIYNRHSCFFSVRLLSVLRGHSVFSSPPQRPMTSDFEGFSIADFIHYIYFPVLILEKNPVFPLLRFNAKQVNYWYDFITSLVWRGPWLGIEPGTSHTHSQHSTTMLSRRRYWYSYFSYQVQVSKNTVSKANNSTKWNCQEQCTRNSFLRMEMLYI